MAQAVNDSPYSVSLPRPYDQVQHGLGYSRHYAQRIKDMGKDSKDSWIKKLWTHMFQGKNRDKSKLRDYESISRSRSRLYGNLSGRESTVSNHSIRNAHSDSEQSSPLRKSKSSLTVSNVKHKSSSDGKSKDKPKSKSNTPNLPPINSKSVVNQSQTRPVLLTPAKSALQPTSVTTLYDSEKEDSNDELGEDEEQEEVPRKSRSPGRGKKSPETKRLSFFERMALASSQSKKPRDVSPKKSEDMLKTEAVKPSHPRPSRLLRESTTIATVSTTAAAGRRKSKSCRCWISGVLNRSHRTAAHSSAAFPGTTRSGQQSRDTGALSSKSEQPE